MWVGTHLSVLRFSQCKKRNAIGLSCGFRETLLKTPGICKHWFGVRTTVGIPKAAQQDAVSKVAAQSGGSALALGLQVLLEEQQRNQTGPKGQGEVASV